MQEDLPLRHASHILSFWRLILISESVLVRLRFPHRRGSRELTSYTLTTAYIYDKSRSKGKGTKSKPGVDEEDEDDDDFPTANKKRTGAAKSTGTQMKLGFAPVTTKAKPRAAAVKAKGKSKQIVEDTEDDEDEVDELAGGSEDEDFEMEMDGPSAHQPASKRASNSRVKATASQKSPAVKATKGKKAAMIDIVLSGSESDDGVTFRGFGAKKSTATQKKKK